MTSHDARTADQSAAAPELPAFFPYLGMSVARASKEEAVVHMRVPRELFSPFGTVHGGAIAALIDTAIGIAVACRVAPGDRIATHALNLNYISFTRGPVVIATARVIRVGRSVVHAEAEARGEDGTVVARALATFGAARKKTPAAEEREQSAGGK